MNERTHIDLFTGIGGFSLAARANGVRTIAMCESDSRCQAFLAKAWPGVPVWPDVRTFSMDNAAISRPDRPQRPPEGDSRHEARLRVPSAGPESSLADAGRIGSRQDEPRRGPGERAAAGRTDSGRVADTIKGDFLQSEAGREGGARIDAGRTTQGGIWLLTAGVPCQPASRAGKQRGKEDDRWLWPAALSVFAAIRPAWGLFENPPGIGDVGLAGILSDLEAQGYAVRVFSLGACALGAPHRRMRYWIVCRRLADASEAGQQRYGRRGMGDEQARRQDQNGPTSPCSQSQLANAPQRGQREHGSASGDAGHTDQCGQGGMGDTGHESNGPEQRHKQGEESWRSPTPHDATRLGAPNQWSNYVWLPCSDGKVRRAPDDSFSLVDGLHRSVLGALGNSIVPQIAAQIIAAMISSENNSTFPVDTLPGKE